MDSRDWRSIISRVGPPTILVILFAAMFWIRTRPKQRIVMENTVLFGSGNDPWYHARIIQLTVTHFPNTPNFDPWSYFPYGTGRHSGFGGLFDQLIALTANIIGVGSPSPYLVEVVTAYAPPVFGAITVIPVYLFAKQLTDRFGGVITATLLALIGGQLLSRTIIGTADHQAAESLFGALAMLGFLYAIRTGYEEKPTIADIRDRNRFVLRRPIAASVLGGVAIASYLMIWPPGVMLVFTMGAYALMQITRDHIEGRAVEYVVSTTATTMIIAGVLTLTYAKSHALQATAYSLLQPLVTLGIAIGVIGLFFLSNYFHREGFDARYYPISVGAAILISLAIVSVVFPRGIDLLQSLVGRIYSFGLLTSPSALTVGEIQPPSLNQTWQTYGVLFYLALAGAFVMLVRVARENRPVELLVLLWSFTIFSAYFTMARFGYYLAVNIAILSGFLIWWVSKNLLSINASFDDPTDLSTYQIIGVIIILITVLPGNVVAVQGQQPVWQTADRLGGADMSWHEELSWMEKNTPGIPLDYYEIYRPPDDGDFDYPHGAYGVMSWWDYGHWITYQAHRIPFANPFQQGPVKASAYFQAQTEKRANLIAQSLASLDDQEQSIGNLSNDDLRSIIDAQSDQEAHEDIRYVVIDDQMVAGKFAPIATWTGPGYGSYVSRQRFQIGDQTVRINGMNERYRNTMLYKLYFQDAQSLEHYRLVHESGPMMSFVSVAQRTSGGYRTIPQYLNRRLSPRLFQAVQSRSNLAFYDTRQAARVKTFEYVPGARLTGKVTHENTSNVYAFVQLRTSTGRNFTYVQSTDVGNDSTFSMTVPYATNNDMTPSEGGTNVSVMATGQYQVVESNPFNPTGIANVSVPERTIYEGSSIEVQIDPITENESTENGSSAQNTNSNSYTGPELSRRPDLGTENYPVDTSPVSQIASTRD